MFNVKEITKLAENKPILMFNTLSVPADTHYLTFLSNLRLPRE